MTSIYFDDSGKQTTYNLLWLDDNLHNQMDLEERLVKIIPFMASFDNYEDCEKAIKELKDDAAAILIVSTSMAQRFVERFHQLEKVTKILIHSPDLTEFGLESLSKLYDKVRGCICFRIRRIDQMQTQNICIERRVLIQHRLSVSKHTYKIV